MEKISLPILLSISAFSILFSFSFLPISDLLNLFRSYITDRNYIFLFCNGILVFIIKSSGFASDSSSNSEKDTNSYTDKHTQTSSRHEFGEKKTGQVQSATELTEEKADYKEEVVVESEAEEVRVYESLGEEQEEDEYVYECEDEDDFFVIEDEEFGALSTEELNKKCDDFIRKMREGINIQA